MLRVLRHSAFITIATIAAAACGDNPVAPGERYGDAFSRMWEAFDAQYPSFGLKGVDWASIRAQYAGPAAGAASTSAFIDVVKTALAPLRDGHAYLLSPGGQSIPTFTSSRFVNWDQTVWLQYAAQGGWIQAKPNLGWAEFAGVAYIAIGGWNSAQFSAADVDQILERFRGRSHLIIDVRPNPGGDDQLARDVAARFTPVPVTGEYLQFRNGPRHDDLTPETPRTIQPRGTWQFTGTVHVLAGRRSASSNETFVAFMREMPHVAVVGDTTAGSSGNPQFVDLVDGWRVGVPRWIVRTADRKVVEGAGIAPDLYVPLVAADFEAGRDPVLDYSVGFLREAGARGAPRAGPRFAKAR